MQWPTDPVRLEELQREISSLRPPPWVPGPGITTGGCFVCFGRGGSGPGAAGDRAWAAAAVTAWRRLLATTETAGEAGASYMSGLLAAREGAILEAAVRSLPWPPDVLLVNATGLDHPRRTGLARHLGWVLDVPTVGVTHRPLVATGGQPGSPSGSRSALMIGDEQVGWWVRTRSGTRPVAVSAGWRTTLDTAAEIVEATAVRARTPEPLRQARRLARTSRSRDEPAPMAVVSQLRPEL